MKDKKLIDSIKYKAVEANNLPKALYGLDSVMKAIGVKGKSKIKRRENPVTNRQRQRIRQLKGISAREDLLARIAAQSFGSNTQDKNINNKKDLLSSDMMENNREKI